jgi:hypothetical protein
VTVVQEKHDDNHIIIDNVALVYQCKFYIIA